MAHMSESEGETRRALIKNLKEATERANAASRAYDAVMRDIPSGIPPPDGVQRIQNASRDLSQARAAMMKAHIRLNEFFGRAIGPADLESECGPRVGPDNGTVPRHKAGSGSCAQRCDQVESGSS